MTESILTTAGFLSVPGTEPGVSLTEPTDIAMEPIDQQEEEKPLDYESSDEIEPSQLPPVAGPSRNDRKKEQSVTDQTSRRDKAQKRNQNHRADELERGQQTHRGAHNHKGDQSRVGEKTGRTDQTHKRDQIERS